MSEVETNRYILEVRQHMCEFQYCAIYGFTDVNLTNNYAEFSGGAVHSTDSKLTFSGSMSFVGNSATERGGGAVYAERSKIILQGSIRFVYNRVNWLWRSYFHSMDGTVKFQVT